MLLHYFEPQCFILFDGYVCLLVDLIILPSFSIPFQESFLKVYQWKYIHCLELWTAAICAYSSEPDFRPLAYPLTQIISGAARLVPTARYFPLRLRCIKMLNRIAASTNSFVPVSTLLLDMLEIKELHRPPTGGVGKAIDFRTVLRVLFKCLSIFFRLTVYCFIRTYIFSLNLYFWCIRLANLRWKREHFRKHVFYLWLRSLLSILLIGATQLLSLSCLLSLLLGCATSASPPMSKDSVVKQGKSFARYACWTLGSIGDMTMYYFLKSHVSTPLITLYSSP